MKRILSVFLIMTLCVGLIATTAFADDVNTNTNVNVNVIYNNAPTPSGGPGGGPGVGPGGGPSAPGPSSSSSGYSTRQKRNALRLFFIDLKKELNRELDNTSGSLIEFKDGELDRSMRRIAKVTVKSDKNPAITCYVVALPKGRITLKGNGKFDPHTYVEVFFVWNYNRDFDVSSYEPSWFITDRDQSAGEAIVQFVDMLLKGELVRPE